VTNAIVSRSDAFRRSTVQRFRKWPGLFTRERLRYREK